MLHEVEGTRRDELLAAASSLPLSATHAAWPAVLEGLDEVLRSCTYPTKQLTILTDLRKAGWDRSVTSTAGRWKQEGVRVRIVDVGDDETANVALQGARPAGSNDPLGSTQPLGGRRSATTRPRVISGAKAILRVDDKPTELTLPEIAPREVARVPLAVQFPGSGPHEFSLQLPDDALAGRQPALGGRAGQGLALDPPGRRRAVGGAVRLGDRLSGRALVDRHRRGRGLAGRSRSSTRISSRRGSRPPTCSCWPTSRRSRPRKPSGSARW